MTAIIEITAKNSIAFDAYPNAFEDSDPPLPELLPEDSEARIKLVMAFGDEVFRAFEVDETDVRELWTDFMSTF